MHRSLLSLSISILLFHSSIGQSKSDTAFVSGAIKHAKRTYTQRSSSLLQNGVEHKHYRDDIEADAYLNPEWTNGSVLYDGQLYENVPLMYDMIAQRVATYFPSQVDIDLTTEKVEWFMIDGRKFVNMSTGFYELLENGEVKLYARRRKRIDQKTGEKKITYSVLSTNHFFLYKNGEYIPVNRKGQLVKALSDKKRESKIAFNKGDKEKAMKQYVARYNELP